MLGRIRTTVRGTLGNVSAGSHVRGGLRAGRTGVTVRFYTNVRDDRQGPSAEFSVPDLARRLFQHDVGLPLICRVLRE